MPYEHFIPVTRMNGEMNSGGLGGIFLRHCLLYFPHISVPFNCSDTTALRVTQTMICPKVKIFVFHHVCFVFRFWRQNLSPGSLTFSHLGNQAKFTIPSNCTEAHVPTPRYGQYLTHAYNYITRAVAAMNSCFALVGAHQHGIAVTCVARCFLPEKNDKLIKSNVA